MKIELEFTVLNHITLVKLASKLYQYIKDNNLLEDFNKYVKDSK